MHHPGIEYTSKPPAPGEYFDCSRWGACLSVSTCAGMWKSANGPTRPLPESRLYRCHRCEVGGSHAGQPAETGNELFGKRICDRCHRLSSRIIHGELCVSCYNREREVIIGKNGRGAPPVKHPPLSPRRVLVSVDGRVAESIYPHTVDMTEVYVSIMRHQHGLIIFGFKGHVA